MHWQQAAERAKNAIDREIREEWRLQGDVDELRRGDMRSVPASCGILSEKQIFITELSAVELLQRLSTGTLSSTEVVEAFSARTAIAHQLVSCLTSFFSQQALQRAAELDGHLRRFGKPVGPLHGLPVAIKDTYDMVGQATTYGYAANINVIADRDSAVVKILRDAGAIFYCKTTMPQTGQALETVSPLFGRTLNPFNAQFVAGGSSGGDAALVALRGSPIAPSTDIGGSIRAPAAFNGLYGIRPSADRIPKRGMRSVERGQPNIRVSCGPVAHCIEDLAMFTRILNAYPQARYDPTSIPLPWRDVPRPMGNLVFGVLEYDGVVMPHPPIRRAIRETVSRLQEQGHEVVPFTIPFDCWESSKLAFSIYYQTGDDMSAALLAQAGETAIPAIKQLLEVYPPKILDAKELLELVHRQTRYKIQFSDKWDSTVNTTNSDRPIDGLICPVAPSAGYPHDFLPWWGYTQVFNVLDYPSVVVPLKDFKIDEVMDAPDLSYKPQANNPFDREYQTMYDPVLFQNQPVAIQLVGRPFEDEELLRVAEVVDGIVNPHK